MSLVERFQSANSTIPSWSNGSSVSPHDTARLPFSINRKGLVLSLMIALSLTGLAITSYLSYVSLTSSKIGGCSGGAIFDCSSVMGSKWSSALGVPVPVPALAIYSLLTVALFTKTFARTPGIQKAANVLMTFAAMTAAAAAVWFISLQLFVVEHLCSYCLATHACSLVLASLVIGTQRVSRSLLLAAGTFALIGTGTMAIIQMNTEAPKTYTIETYDTKNANTQSGNTPADGIPVFQPPGADEDTDADSQVFEAPVNEQRSTSDDQGTISWRESLTGMVAMMQPSASTLSVIYLPASLGIQDSENRSDDSGADRTERRMVNFKGGQFRLNAHDWPLYGAADAETIGVEMFDYTCPHCRATHQAIKAAMQESGNRFALISLVVPLDRKCNPAVQSTSAQHAEACEIAELSVAVWRVAPDKFQDFHDWIFAGDRAPTAREVRTQAAELVGESELDAELDSGMPQKYVAKQCELYRQVGAGIVPKISFGNRMATGRISTKQEFIQLTR